MFTYLFLSYFVISIIYEDRFYIKFFLQDMCEDWDIMANVEMIVHDNAANMLGTRLENFNLIFVRGEIGFFYLEYSIYSNMPKTLIDR